MRWILPIILAGAAIAALAASSVTSAAAGKHPARGSHPTNVVTRPRAHVANFCCGNPGSSSERAQGIFRNLTPYPLTFVTSAGLRTDQNLWDVSRFPKTLNPGDQFIYQLAPFNNYATTTQYGGFFTYRADTVSGPEYLSLMLSGSHCTEVCLPRDGPILSISPYNGSAEPTYTNYDWHFGPPAVNPEVAWTSSGTTDVWPCFLCKSYTADFDYTFEVRGTYNIDASKIPSNQSGALADVLNGACTPPPKGLGATCSFEPTTPLTFGPGPLTPYTDQVNCEVQNPPNQKPVPAAKKEVAVTQSREASVSVGGSVSVGVEADVFGVIEAGVSAKFGVEHEWSDESEFKKSMIIFVPAGWVGQVWVAAEQGTVTGTFALKTSKASYTFTNLTNKKDGVQPDPKTPPYDLFFNARAMTKDEFKAACQTTPRSGTAPSRGLG